MLIAGHIKCVIYSILMTWNQFSWGSAVGQLGERWSNCLPSELNSNVVRVRASPALKYFQSGGCINLSHGALICMWSGYRLAYPVVSQAYAEICPGFPPSQAALIIATSRENFG